MEDQKASKKENATKGEIVAKIKTASSPKKVRDVGAEVYRWASSIVGEVIEKGEDKFYKTELFNQLSFKTKHTIKGLIAISGLQGTGKTRLLSELAASIPNSLMIKWTRNWQKDAEDWSPVLSKYDELVRNESEARLEDWCRKSIKKHLTSKLGRISSENFDSSYGEMILGKGYCRKLKMQAFTMALSEFSVLLLDMPDYSKSNASLMNADIDELQSFWETLDKKCVHIIVGVQKELVMKHPHFFWGKCDIMTLDPLSPAEMVKAFKFITEDPVVFDDSALHLLAVLSRGIFRRFKKYTRLTIESNLDEEIPLRSTHVEKAVNERHLFEDMELEMCDIFIDREKRLQALNILSFLQNNNNVNIKTVAEGVRFSETITQKIVQKLELYKYVTTKRGAGKEKLVSLQL